MKKEIHRNKNYLADTKGNIYNKKTGHKIAQYVNRDGYSVVDIWEKNKATRVTVHRLVAIAHIPNPLNLPCVNHIDGVKTNNDISNLEWVTYRQNAIHALELGLKIPLKGSEVHNSILDEEAVKTICELMQDGLRNKEIMKIIDVAPYTLKSIRRSITWTHISDSYNIPRRVHVISDDTARWICKKIEEGFKNAEIVRMSTNPRVNKSLVSKIKRRLTYKHISCNYNF